MTSVPVRATSLLLCTTLLLARPAIAVRQAAGADGAAQPATPSAPATAPPGRAARATSVERFERVGLMVPDGETATERQVAVLFDSDGLVVQDRESGAELKRFGYEEIVGGDYSYSKAPRWKTGVGVAVAVGVFALPVFFMKGKKHWFTVKGAGDYAVLHLDKNNFRSILAAFETRTGKRVELMGEER